MATLPQSGIDELPPGVRAARTFAIAKHGDQMYGREPYISHLDDVLVSLADFQFPISCLQAAYLHDVLEDVKQPGLDAEMVEEFGDPVVSIVRAVTLNPRIQDSLDRQKDAFARAAAHGPHAVAVKVADRLCNVIASLRLFVTDPDGAERYLLRYRQSADAMVKAFTPAALENQSLNRLWRGLLILQQGVQNPKTWLDRQLQAKWIKT